MPTFMVMLPALTAHSRAVWDTEAWKRTLVGPGSPPGAFTASVAAPERTVTLGHSRFGSGPAGAVAATFSWPVELPAENRFFTRWVNEPLGASRGVVGCRAAPGGPRAPAPPLAGRTPRGKQIFHALGKRAARGIARR